MIKTKNFTRSKGVLVGISGLNAMDHPGLAAFISVWVYILMIIELVYQNVFNIPRIVKRLPYVQLQMCKRHQSLTIHESEIGTSTCL